jgi:hypothetical protein
MTDWESAVRECVARGAVGEARVILSRQDPSSAGPNFGPWIDALSRGEAKVRIRRADQLHIAPFNSERPPPPGMGFPCELCEDRTPTGVHVVNLSGRAGAMICDGCVGEFARFHQSREDRS